MQSQGLSLLPLCIPPHQHHSGSTAGTFHRWALYTLFFFFVPGYMLGAGDKMMRKRDMSSRYIHLPTLDSIQSPKLFIWSSGVLKKPFFLSKVRQTE